MSRQTFSHSAVTSASPAEVWRALDLPETWEGIGGVNRVFDPEIDGEGRLRGFRFETLAAGSRYRGEATPRARQERRLMSWNIESPEVRGVITVESAQAEDGTEISVELTVESLGVLSTVFFPVVAGAIGNGLPGAVEDFARNLEAAAVDPD